MIHMTTKYVPMMYVTIQWRNESFKYALEKISNGNRSLHMTATHSSELGAIPHMCTLLRMSEDIALQFTYIPPTQLSSSE